MGTTTVRLDLASLIRAGALSKPGKAGALSFTTESESGSTLRRLTLRWDPVDGGGTLSLGTSAQDQVGVCLEALPQHFGGVRLWFRCPPCGRRRRILHIGTRGLACRACHGLAYLTTRMTNHERLEARVKRAERRFGLDAFQGRRRPRRPTGMRRATYQRLLTELREADELLELSEYRRIAKFLMRLGLT